jgi:hypothetical protein
MLLPKKPVSTCFPPVCPLAAKGELGQGDKEVRRLWGTDNHGGRAVRSPNLDHPVTVRCITYKSPVATTTCRPVRMVLHSNSSMIILSLNQMTIQPSLKGDEWSNRLN